MKRSDIRVWGPNGWGFLHTVAFAWHARPTHAQRRAMYGFLHSFAAALPCGQCRAHFTAHVRATVPTWHAPALHARGDLAHWAWAAHNAVNARLGKPEPTFAEVASEYGIGEHACAVSAAGAHGGVPPEAIVAASGTALVLALLLLGTCRPSQWSGV